MRHAPLANRRRTRDRGVGSGSVTTRTSDASGPVSITVARRCQVPSSCSTSSSIPPSARAISYVWSRVSVSARSNSASQSEAVVPSDASSSYRRKVGTSDCRVAMTSPHAPSPSGGRSMVTNSRVARSLESVTFDHSSRSIAATAAEQSPFPAWHSATGTIRSAFQ